MAKFKVGDRARVVWIRRQSHAASVGDEVVVHDAVPGRVEYPDGEVFDYEYICRVEGRKGRLFAMGWQLEPLTPDLGSWEEIERLTKWKPQWVTA